MALTRHGGVLKEKIAVRKQELLEQLLQGLSQESYWTIIGQINGLAEAAALSDEADKVLSGGS